MRIPEFNLIIEDRDVNITFTEKVPEQKLFFELKSIMNCFVSVPLNNEILNHLQSKIIYHLQYLINSGRLYFNNFTNKWEIEEIENEDI